MYSLFDLQRIFSRQVLLSLAEKRDNDFFQNCFKQYSINNYADLFENVFIDFSKKYRNDLYYRNLIAVKLFLSRHKFGKSVLLNELRIGKSKADLVIINDSSTAYEIKSDIDKLDRLENQVSDYLKVFDKVYLVINQEKGNQLIQSLPDKIGIIGLTPKNTFHTIRRAISNKNFVKQSVIFNTLRKNEYMEIIKKRFGFIPDVPNTRIYAECKKLFLDLTPQVAHDEFVKSLKHRSKYSSFLINNIDKFPISINYSLMTADLDDIQCNNLLTQLYIKRS
jgi:hypothetical protein